MFRVPWGGRDDLSRVKVERNRHNFARAPRLTGLRVKNPVNEGVKLLPHLAESRAYHQPVSRPRPASVDNPVLEHRAPCPWWRFICLEGCLGDPVPPGSEEVADTVGNASDEKFWNHKAQRIAVLGLNDSPADHRRSDSVRVGDQSLRSWRPRHID